MMCIYNNNRSPDSRTIVTGGTAGILRIWNLRLEPSIALSCISHCKGHSNAITSVTFSLDGRQIVSVGEDGAIFVWTVYTS